MVLQRLSSGHSFLFGLAAAVLAMSLGGCDTSESCEASNNFECVQACGSDALVASVCEQGTWECPTGYVPVDECPSSCNAQEAFECVQACGSDALVASVCEQGTWKCPPNHVRVDECS